MRKRVVGGIMVLGMLLCGCGQSRQPVETQQVETEQEELQQEDQELNREEVVSPYEFDFQGVEGGEQAHVWGNTPTNLKSMIPGLVCPGENTTYYVNCGRDNYLYQLEDNESKLILSEVVTSLNFWEGELYFVLHEDGDIRGMGKVCKYNLQTGEMEVVFDVESYYCCVTESGIYYTEGKIETYDWGCVKGEELMYYSFADGKVTEYPGRRWHQYGSYYAQSLTEENELVGIGLKSMDTDELIPIYPLSQEVFLTQDSICDGRYCGISSNGNEFVWIDLWDGNSNKVTLPNTGFYNWIYDYISWNDKICLSLGEGVAMEEQLAFVDLQNATMEKMSVWIEEQTYSWEEIQQGNYEEKIAYSYQELYTDGRNLFVLKHFYDEESVSLEDGLLLVQLVEGENGFYEVELGAK